jgi:hypothetical protein
MFLSMGIALRCIPVEEQMIAKVFTEAERAYLVSRLGDGSAFKRLVAKLKKRGGVSDPKALAAYIGRKKYGKAKFQKMAAQGRRRAAR